MSAALLKSSPLDARVATFKRHFVALCCLLSAGESKKETEGRKKKEKERMRQIEIKTETGSETKRKRKIYRG